MALTILKVWLVALVWLAVTGYGPARLLTPSTLWPVRPLLVPFFGYALTVLAAYYALWLGVALDTARWAILALAAAIAIWSWLPRYRPSEPPLRWGELGLACGLALLAGTIAALPTLSHGVLAPIGASWDVEFYIPLATYLRQYTYTSVVDAPANPMIDAVRGVPTVARAIGFSYLHAIVDSWRDWDALRTFAPLTGLMRLLAAPAVFVFARYGLRLGVWGAALATLLVACNELLLWVQYDGLAMHTSSMPLVPIALGWTVVALRELRWRATGAAALLLAGLAASYHPGLLGYGALALGAGIYFLLVDARRKHVLVHGLGLLVGAAALSWLVHWRAPVAFFGVYETGAAPLGTPGFISLRTLLGLTPLASAERIAPPPWGAVVAGVWPALVWLAYGLALAAGLLWLAAGRGARGLGVCMLITTAVYALGLRYVVGYPYGHMKGLSFVSFALLCMVAGGVERLGQLRMARPARISLAGLVAAVLVLVAGATAWDSYTLVRGDTIVYGREDLALLDLPNAVPEGAPVLVMGDSALRGPNAALLAHALREHPLVGRVTTGYVRYNRLAEGTTAPYGVFSPGADPTAWGYDPKPLWRSSAAVLYAAPAQRLAHLNGRLGGYTAEQPSALQATSALQLALLNHGAYRSLREPLELAVSAGNVSRQLPAGGEAATRRLVLALAVAEPATLRIETGGRTQSVELASGLHELPVEVAAPAGVRLSSDGDAVLRWAELYPTDAPQRPAAPAGAALQATVTPAANGAMVRLATTPAQQRLRVALEIYEDAVEPGHYGWTVLPWGPAELELDLSGRTLRVNGADVPMQWGERQAGSYFAALWVYQGNTLLDRLPLFSFDDSGTEIGKVRPLDTNVVAMSLPQPTTAIDAGFEDLARLAGATVSALAAGRTGQVSLWWQTEGPTLPLLVTVQLVDAAGTKWAQWDGLLGGDAAPSQSWQPGEVIRQDVPLAVDAATPPGDYQMLIGVYRPDGTRVQVAQNGQAAGDAVLLRQAIGK